MKQPFTAAAALELQADRDRLAATIKEMVESLELMSLQHHECEDSWYSCPKSPGGCSNDEAGDNCDCGADAHNARIDAILARATGK